MISNVGVQLFRAVERLPDEESRWALDDYVIGTQHGLSIHGAAFYEDRYVKLDHAWKIPRRQRRSRSTPASRRVCWGSESLPGLARPDLPNLAPRDPISTLIPT